FFLFYAVDADGQLHLAQHNRAIRLWPHDEKLALVIADIDLSIREHGRSFLALSKRHLPQKAARIDVVSAQVRPAIKLIDPIAVDERRRERKLDTLYRPLRRLDVAGLRSVDGREHAQLVRIHVLVAARDDHGVALDHDAGIDRAL